MEKKLADELTKIALEQLIVSTDFKEPRLQRIRIYEEAYLGKVRAQPRIMFNLPNLVFSGMIDALKSDLDEKISPKFEENAPEDFNSIRKLNAFWKVDSTSLRPEARWNLKVRMDKVNALFFGRGIQKTYAESTPKYRSNFEVVNPRSFHCEPKGGAILEKHLFCGEEDIWKSKADLEAGTKSGLYDAAQLKLILDKQKSSTYKDEMRGAYGDKLTRFEAMGMNAQTNSYVGEEMYNLCEWMLNKDGKRYYILFDPYSREWLRVEEWNKVFESGLLHWTSWATHEDPVLFWSKAYSDDLYPIGESVKNLMDQEFTNRVKRNLGAKGYDPRWFKDVAKLDDAQYRPDALVPVWVPEGKSIKDGIFQFETPELTGTINLINWVEQDLGKHSGITELNQQQKGVRANVQYSLLQQAQKRIGYQAQAYQECFQEISLRWVWGLIEHFNEKTAIKLGVEWADFDRSDLRFKKGWEVRIVNQAEEDKLNVLGKDQKFKGFELLIGNPELIKTLNPKVLSETILRDVSGLSEDSIHTLMDMQNYGSKDVLAEADKAIATIRRGKTPELCYDATTAFLERIHRYERANHNSLSPEKQQMFQDYFNQHITIVQENMQSIADKINLEKKMASQEQPEQPEQPRQQTGQPRGIPQQAPMMARPQMAMSGGELSQ